MSTNESQPELPIGLVKINNDNWSPQYTGEIPNWSGVIIDSFSCRRVEHAYYYTGEAPYYPISGTIIGSHYDGAYIKPVVSKPIQNFESRLAYLLGLVKCGKGDSDQHLLSLFSIGMSVTARNILELGVRGGSTTLPLLMCVKENGGFVDSVDIETTQFECPSDLSYHWRFHKSDAIKYLEECVKEGRKFDLIYVDDWHSYNHVKKELELIDQLVTPKSIILLHDLMYGKTEPYYHCDLTVGAGKQWSDGGPYRAVAELNPQFWEFSTIPICNGLTILRKKYSSKY